MSSLIKPTPHVPTPESLLEYAKLGAVRKLVEVMQANEPVAFHELMYRLTNSFKGRIITDVNDTSTPEQCAQGLLVAVLMSAIGVDQTPRQTIDAVPAGQYAVIHCATHQVMRSFATEGEARAFLSAGVIENGLPIDDFAVEAGTHVYDPQP